MRRVCLDCSVYFLAADSQEWNLGAKAMSCSESLGEYLGTIHLFQQFSLQQEGYPGQEPGEPGSGLNLASHSEMAISMWT